MNLPYAEDMNYWKTGKSSPDIWIDKAKAEIEKAGGRLLADGYASSAVTGNSAYVIQFEVGDELFRATWPVLSARSNSSSTERYTKIQAATMLYHDVKSRCVAAKVHGARSAFLGYLVMPNGDTASNATSHELFCEISSKPVAYLEG